MERAEKGKEVGGAGWKRKDSTVLYVHTSKTAGLDANEGSVRSNVAKPKCWSVEGGKLILYRTHTRVANSNTRNDLCVPF